MVEYCVLCGIQLHFGHYGYCTNCWKVGTGQTPTGTFTDGISETWLSGGMDEFKRWARNESRRKHHTELTFTDLPETFFSVRHIEILDGNLIGERPVKVQKSSNCE